MDAVVFNGFFVGLIYGLIGVGLVVSYRGSRVVNFAYGEIGMIAAFFFAGIELLRLHCGLAADMIESNSGQAICEITLTKFGDVLSPEDAASSKRRRPPADGASSHQRSMPARFSRAASTPSSRHAA